DCPRHRYTSRLVLEPMCIDAGPQLDGRIHPEPPRRLELTPIVADILPAAFRILGDVVAGGEIRRIVETGCGNRHRQPVERSARNIERVAEHANVLAWPRPAHARIHWSRDPMPP